jgi:lipopolysaccharide export system protein LptA
MEFLSRYLRPLLFACLLLGGVLGLTSLALSQTPAKTAEPGDLPLNITADRLEVEQNEQVISFLNNVVARYKDMILYADVLKIFYESKTTAPGSQPGTGPRPAQRPAPAPPTGAAKEASSSPLGAVGIEKISRIEALGHVRMVQGDRVAVGDKAIYYAPEEKLVLMGNPQLWRGDNSLRGHEIVFFLKENRAVVTGEPNKRVEAVIHPSQKAPLPGRQSTPSP